MVLRNGGGGGSSWASAAAAAALALLALLFSQLFVSYYYSSVCIFSFDRSSSSSSSVPDARASIAVYVADLPRTFNYGLLQSYWLGQGRPDNAGLPILPYPDDPLCKQYSAEYWILGQLMSSPGGGSVARRVTDPAAADVVFVPFFAALSAELQLSSGRGRFRHHKGNSDFERQKQVMEIVTNSPRWAISEGRDHVFVLTDPVAMWHFRAELANSILLVVDFGGWYMEDARSSNGTSQQQQPIHHTQVSLIKDVIVPYTHLLPTLPLSQDAPRTTLLYFRGARYRHRTGLVRDQLWNVLDGAPGVVLEEGFPNKTGQVQAIQGMRSSEFCLHPAGDTPSSCRLFDAVASLCIPVIVSDSVELPFEGMLDYSDFSVFVSVQDALRPGWLIQHLDRITHKQRSLMRHRLATVQRHFEYDDHGPDGAVNMIWRKVRHKLPAVKEAISRIRRKPANAALPSARCHCL